MSAAASLVSADPNSVVPNIKRVTSVQEAMAAVNSPSVRAIRVVGDFFNRTELQAFGQKVKTSKLTVLEWEKKSIQAGSGMAISSMLFKHPTIQKVGFYHCVSGDTGEFNGFRQIGWMENTVLQRVEIEQCGLGAEERDRITGYQKRNLNKQIILIP